VRRPLVAVSVLLGAVLVTIGAVGVLSPTGVATVGDAPEPQAAVAPAEVPTGGTAAVDTPEDEAPDGDPPEDEAPDADTPEDEAPDADTPEGDTLDDEVADVEVTDDAAEVPVPVALEIPALTVDAEVVPVGLEDDGTMEIPEDVATAGWYDLGVAPNATAGSAVLAGHVDSRTQGRGAFFDLRELDVDDEATVRHEDGTETSWQVTARTSYPKDEAPLAELFAGDGPPRLVLITCGGEFDATARSYDENVVVILEPVV
jgi:hypothetical protein